MDPFTKLLVFAPAIVTLIVAAVLPLIMLRGSKGDWEGVATACVRSERIRNIVIGTFCFEAVVGGIVSKICVGYPLHSFEWLIGASIFYHFLAMTVLFVTTCVAWGISESRASRTASELGRLP